MDYNKIKKELRAYILKELEIAGRENCTLQEALSAQDRAYGALMFVNNMVIPYDTNLETWWNNYIKDRFIP